MWRVPTPQTDSLVSFLCLSCYSLEGQFDSSTSYLGQTASIQDHREVKVTLAAQTELCDVWLRQNYNAILVQRNVEEQYMQVETSIHGVVNELSPARFFLSLQMWVLLARLIAVTKDWSCFPIKWIQRFSGLNCISPVKVKGLKETFNWSRREAVHVILSVVRCAAILNRFLVAHHSFII